MRVVRVENVGEAEHAYDNYVPPLPVLHVKFHDGRENSGSILIVRHIPNLLRFVVELGVYATGFQAHPHQIS